MSPQDQETRIETPVHQGPPLPAITGRIHRPRLSAMLVQRFDHRLSIVSGSAGFGKTTALALAIEDNRLDPRGRDVWLPAAPRDADPVVWTAGICRALDIAPLPHWLDAIERITDEIWSQSPNDVALIVDDAHLISATADGVEAIRTMLELLPRNGHLVLGTRDHRPIPFARLEVNQEVLLIDETDLAFDHRELDALTDTTDGGALLRHRLPSWPALAALQLRSGVDSSFDYIWQEILDRLTPSRVEHLRALAALPSFDDEIVAAVTDGEVTSAPTLVEGLAGVDLAGDRVRLHSLVRDAILETTPPEQQQRAFIKAGRAELGRGNHRTAVEHFVSAGAAEEAIKAALDFAHLPIMMMGIDDLVVLRSSLTSLVPSHPLVELFAASLFWETEEREAASRFEAVAESAERLGMEEVETIALWRAVQAHPLAGHLAGDKTERRAKILAETQPFAKGIVRLMRSHERQFAGDPQAALDAASDLSMMGQYNESILHAQRCGDMGRPEQVRVDDGAGELTSLFHAQAIWLMGEVSPEDAVGLARPVVEETRRRGILHERISLLGVMTLIALAAGEVDQAREWSREATELVPRSYGPAVDAFAEIAAAAVACLDHGDDAAAEVLSRSFDHLSPDPWPSRAHWYALSLIYVSTPEHRSLLDGISIGPALSTAVDLGRALVAARDGDAGPALSMPWHNPHLMRAQMLVPHLTELAAVAATAGETRAEDLLDSLPDHHLTWPRLVEHAIPAVARRAAKETRERSRPAHPLRIHALGRFEIDRGRETEVNDEWDRRERVRQMLAFLVEHRRTTRSAMRAALWPDLDDKKADNNLRVNLSHLRQILEPDREARQETWFVRIQGEHIELTKHVWVDTDEFERLAGRALTTDQSGAPAAALDEYQAALDLYRGDYLSEYTAHEWGALERFRLRTIATSSMCRIGELELARGEPERASSWAVRAQRLDPLLERAGRLLIRSFLAIDDRSAALQAGTTMRDRLATAELTLEPDSVRLIDSIGLGSR